MDKKRGFDSADRKRIMNYITDKDKELAEALSKAMFTFNDLKYVTQAGIQLLVKNIDREKWLLALRNINDELLTYLFSRLS